MNLDEFLAWQFRAALVLAVGGWGVDWLCRRRAIDDSRLRFGAAFVVLALAWWPWGWRVELPWYAPQEETIANGNDDQSVAQLAVAASRMGETRPLDFRSTLPNGDDSSASAFVNSDTELNRDANVAELNSNGAGGNASHFGTILSRNRWRMGALFFVAWCGVVVARLTVGAFRYVAVLAEVARSESPPQQWCDEWKELQLVHGVRRLARLRTTNDVGPMLGWLPRGFTLLVPGPFWEKLGCTERRLVIRHELAHYLRGDVLASCVLRLLSLPFAYHPASWRLVRLFDDSAEWACDAWAAKLGAADGGAVAYARILERLAAAELPETSLAMGRCAHSHPLVLRVRRVLCSSNSPGSGKGQLMTRSLLVGALLSLAFASLVQVRLTAQDGREAAIERVKQQIQEIEGDIADIRSAADSLKESGKKIEAKVQERLQTLKRLAEDQSSWSADGRERLEKIKSGDEAKELAALTGVEKTGDEGLIVLAHAILANERESVRRKALAITCSLGDEGLPVLAKAFESLARADRAYATTELVKNKDKFDAVIFARLARDEVAEIREPAVKAGLSKGTPLAFVATLGDNRPEVINQLWESSQDFSRGDLRVFLYTIAKNGPADRLPETVERAVKLGEEGYPVIAAVFQRKTPESRAAIVKAYRKSTKSVEQFIVEESLKDGDETLRAAAEKAKAAP